MNTELYKPGQYEYKIVVQSAGTVEYTDCFSAEG